MTGKNVKPNGWDQWANYVLKELKRLNELYEKLDIKFDQLQVKLIETETKFNIKSGIWGAIAGAIPVMVAVVLWLLSR